MKTPRNMRRRNNKRRPNPLSRLVGQRKRAARRKVVRP